MKKLSLVIFVAILGFSACGDSKDLGESQTINANNSQSKSNESSADSSIESSANPQDSSKSNAQSSESTQSLVWELVDCDFLMKLWGITEKDCSVMDIPPYFATIDAENIKQAYQQLLLIDDYWTLRKTKFLLKKLPMKNHTHTDTLSSEGVEKYTTTYKWKDEKTLEIHIQKNRIQHPDNCTDDYYTFFDLGNGKVKIMRYHSYC